ncbi:MAG: hypothetical protein U1E49_21525 [Hyphomicrobiaceae bacterium]
MIKPISQKRNKAIGEVYWARLPYRTLSKLPEKQVKFLITATRVANDILLLQRMLIASENNLATADNAERQAGTVAWFGTMALLAGKLWEGFEAIKAFASLWKPDSGLALEPEGTAARAELNKMFANGSPLEQVRNRSAFHYDRKDVLDAEVASFRAHTGTANDMEWVLGSEVANTFYLFSAASNGFATLDAAYPGKPRQEQMNALYQDVVGAARVMGTFLQFAFAALLTQSNVKADDHVRLEEITMSGRPHLASTSLPMLTLFGDTQ